MSNHNSKNHIDEDDNDNDAKFKSKNLKAERKRCKKLSSKQLELRSIVPIITNARNSLLFTSRGMNKATIITDAITYIEQLKNSVEELSNQLLQMEATTFDEEKIKLKEIHDEQETKKWGIIPEAEVQVNNISGTKLWIRIVLQKKRGALTKLMEAISLLRIDLNQALLLREEQFSSPHLVR
ncbi:hypothetical protein C2S52_003225 [Perilla frutescens var. hirtella]|nr:hypothetical protein C2S51_012261 [Perilla frutescens var. frutescens]KAH6792748.1 hypothetical protein C2S52_003225 [Perilla frutescens var. hirtella]